MSSLKRVEFLKAFAIANDCDKDESLVLGHLASGWDSLAVLVVVGILDELGVKVPEKEIKEAETLGNLLELLDKYDC